MTRDIARRMAGIYVFILVFTVFPAAQQTNVPAETMRMIDERTLPNSTCGDMGAEPGEGPVELARQLEQRIYSKA